MCDYPMFIKKYSRLSQTSMFKESATNFQCWFSSDVSFQLDIFLFDGKCILSTSISVAPTG